MSEAGVGDNIGTNTHTQTLRDWETSSAALTLKVSSGIVKDTIEQIFSQLNPRYQTGFLGGFGYKAPSSGPVLDHTIENIRISMDITTDLDKNWLLSYETLLKSLPQDLQDRLLAQNALPFESRNFIFVILENLLTLTAKVLAALDTLSQPIESGSLRETRTILNLMLPFQALGGSISVGREIGEAFKNILDNQGANLPGYDATNYALGQMFASIGTLNQVMDNINNLKPGENLSAEDRAKAAKAADRLEDTAKELQRTSDANQNLQMQSTLSALAIIGSSVSLPFAGSAPLFIGLSIATKGLDSDNCGLVGHHVGQAISSSSDGFANSEMAGTNTAGKKMLNMMVSTGMAGALALASQAANGLGPLPGANNSNTFAIMDPLSIAAIATLFQGGEIDPLLSILMASITLCAGIALSVDETVTPNADPADIEMANVLAFKSALGLVNNSNIIDEYFKEAIAISGGNERAQKLGSILFSQLATLLIAIMGSTNKKRYPAEKILEGEGQRLTQGVEAAQEITNDQSSDASRAAAVTLDQLQTALQENNYEGFLLAVNALLENLGSSESQMRKDLDQTKKSLDTLMKTVTSRSDEHPLTGIINIV